MKKIFSVFKKKQNKKEVWVGDPIQVEFVTQSLVSPKPSEVDALIKIKTCDLDEKEKLPVAICIVLDVSGSMSGSAIRNAKAAILYVLDNIGPNDLVSLVTYSNNSKVIFKNLTRSEKKKMISVVEPLQAQGGTNMMCGVDDAKAVLNKASLKDKHILLFTDGMVNVGITSKEKIYDIVKTIKVKDEITINSFGLGEQYEEELMKGVAQKTSGIYYYIEDSDAIKRKFGNAFELLTSIIGRNVVMKLTAMEGSKILKTYGIDEKDSQDEIKIGNLFADDCRNFLIRLSINPQEEKPYFKYCLTGENIEGKEIKLEKHFQMELGKDSKDIKEVTEIVERRIIMDVIKEEGVLAKMIKDEMSESYGGLSEKTRDNAVTQYNKLMEMLEHIREKYEEADFFYKQLETTIKKIKERRFGSVTKTSSYSASYSYQTTKSYV